ncbi:hypothetical protein EDC23_0288 [Thiohalophilus thiocyanatoxydans]|uniref:Uncharacterized protein n=1 Tax=Thiohalophilus thiocyanatoxydans TaxID=381308 RepID=A0A4R8J0U0_9GAMM|nr:hypothetical protein EDC23_0288 [Thiohalophilus thiocyanatoxydans]
MTHHPFRFNTEPDAFVLENFGIYAEIKSMNMTGDSVSNPAILHNKDVG